MQVRARLQVRKWKYRSPLGVMPRGGSNDIVFVSVVNEISPKTDQSASLLKELANQKRGIVIWRPGGGNLQKYFTLLVTILKILKNCSRFTFQIWSRF